MPDTVSKETRSKIMASIHSRDTKIELMLRKALHREGLRYKTHYNVRGHPDIVFPKQKLAIFVDGDFWHGYNWRKLKPKLKNEFWVQKIRRNMQRDKEVNEELQSSGWQIMRVWEHEIRNAPYKHIEQIKHLIKGELQ